MSNSKDNVKVDSTKPAPGAFAVTPHDTTEFSEPARSLYVGVTGNVTILMKSGEVVTFVAVPAGFILPVVAYRVNATATTATNIIGLR